TNLPARPLPVQANNEPAVPARELIELKRSDVGDLARWLYRVKLNRFGEALALVRALVELFFQVTPLGDLARVELPAEVCRQRDQIALAMQKHFAAGKLRIVRAGHVPIVEGLVPRFQM